MKKTTKDIEQILNESRQGAIDLLDDSSNQSHSLDNKNVSNIITSLKDHGRLNSELSRYNRYDSNRAYLATKKRIFRIKTRKAAKIAIAVASCIAVAVFTIYQINPQGSSISHKTTLSSTIHTPSNTEIPSHKLKALLTDNKGVSKNIDAETKKIEIGDLTIENDPVKSMLSYQNTNTTTSSINQLKVPKGSNYQLILQDGTVVTLNSDSYLRYPTSFIGNKREVEIIGEALFDVAHNSKSPFFIKTQHGIIQVFGTLFNVKSYNEEQTTEVTLVEGSVAYGNSRSVVKIKPGEQASTTSQNSNIEIKIVNVSRYTAWTKNTFDYDNTPLYYIINDINRSYDTNITITSMELLNLNVTLKISKDRTLEDVIETLEKSDILKFKMVEGKYMLIKK